MLRPRTTTPDHAHDDHGDHGDHGDHDRGLQFDLSTLVNRRRSLALLGGAGLVSLAACLPEGSSDSTTTTTSASGGGTSTTTGADQLLGHPEETAGPYPVTVPTV